MGLVSALAPSSGLIPLAEWQSKSEDKARRDRERDNDTDDILDLSEEEQSEVEILSYCSNLYDEARKGRAAYENFDIAWDLFIGNIWPRSWPTWRAKITINKIRALVTFMQAIMTDNKPRLSVEPGVPGTEDAADLLRKLVDRDWDENDMQDKLSLFVLYGLIWGTAFLKVTYDPYGDGGRGKHLCSVVPPYRIYSNRTATGVGEDENEYIIHEDDMTFGWIRRNFPTKARAVWAVRGARDRAKEDERDRDFVREVEPNETNRIISAQNVDGNLVPPAFSNPDPRWRSFEHESVTVKEYWLKDDSLEEYSLQKIEGGKPVFEPETDDEGMYVLQTVRQRIATSEIDGQPFLYPVKQPKMKPVMTTAWRPKYPNGRLVIIAADRVLLRDIPNPYQTPGFPFAQWKDYDSGVFWGGGEPLALKDTQIAYVKIISQLFDILEKTGNPIFKYKKGAGVNASSIKNRPGSLIPMDELDAIAPLDKPQIPPQFEQMFTTLQGAMGTISGVPDSVMGGQMPSNTAFATMDQLQESGAAPIRLKVRNLEKGITRFGRLRIALIQQFDRGRRPIREREEQHPNEDGVVQPSGNADLKWTTYTSPMLQGSVQFGIVPISSLSTSPAGAWNRWMTMYDKHLVDRRWWHEKFRIEGWRTNVPRMEANEKKEAQMAAAAKSGGGKPGPAPKSLSTGPRRRKGPGAPPSHVPSRESNAQVR